MKKLFFLLALIAVKTNAQELTLQDAINLALKNSFDIQIAKNVVDANKINNNIGVAGGLPTVAATASNQESVVNINQKLNTGTEITRDGATSNNLTANVSGTMLLYNGYRVVATKKRLEILQQQSEQNKRNITVKASALDVAKEQLGLAESILKNASLKYKEGLISVNDFLMAETGLEQAQAGVVAAYVSLRQAELEYLKTNGNIK